MSKISRLLEPFGDKRVVKAVAKTIKEFKKIGRDEFLKKYGFGKAKTCWLIHEGWPYDSKAIIGVAYGFLDKKAGPLKPSDFHGGDPVLQKLRELGFECEKGSRPARNPATGN